MVRLSPDLIINLTFGTVMVLIGLAGIWIVKWSTEKMILAQQHTGPSSFLVSAPF
jgi:hypothetical protein